MKPNLMKSLSFYVPLLALSLATAQARETAHEKYLLLEGQNTSLLENLDIIYNTVYDSEKGSEAVSMTLHLLFHSSVDLDLFLEASFSADLEYASDLQLVLEDSDQPFLSTDWANVSRSSENQKEVQIKFPMNCSVVSILSHKELSEKVYLRNSGEASSASTSALKKATLGKIRLSRDMAGDLSDALRCN